VDVCILCQFVADDFVCQEEGFIEDIHFWVSWLMDDVGELTADDLDISIYSDAGGVPGVWLWSLQPGAAVRTRLYGQGDEGWWCPSAGSYNYPDHINYYQVNITNIQEPFYQMYGTTYWLVIQAWPTMGTVGWKSSTTAFQNRAVWSVDANPPWQPVYGPAEVYDMAFVITSGYVEPELEYCDAPEGYSAVAYPSTGVIGRFPTCVTSGPASWVQHTNFGAWLGPSFDLETEGDAGLCPPPGCFPPFSPTGTALGIVCQQAVWGQDIDIDVHNHMPSETEGYVNVMLDWLQDGDWGDTAWCGAVPVSEHVLQNFPIPNPYDGPISVLMPLGASFQIGPNPGYVWARVSITEARVPVPWDGSGSFEDGESEAYLIRVDPEPLDFGDAPPPYPTLLLNNGARHTVVAAVYLGAGVDIEPDGQPDPGAMGDDLNLGMYPGGIPYPPGDEDGVQFTSGLIPGQWTTVNVTASIAGVLDAWVDFNGDGDWFDGNEQIFFGLGLVAGNNPLSFYVPATASPNILTFARFRFNTRGPLPVDGPALDGEVEDYLVMIDEMKPPVPHLKWSQPPIEWDPCSDYITYCGWDELSYNWYPADYQWKIVADDFHCIGTMPITSLHWYGSYVDWEYWWAHGTLPPNLPTSWIIGFWTNVPPGAAADYSLPGMLLWQVEVDASRVDVQEVGQDDYFGWYPLDVCYQYHIKLEPEEWFWQWLYHEETDDQIFWVSIVAVYPDDPGAYWWGWKTRPWPWMDDAVTFLLTDKPTPGMTLDPAMVSPLIDPEFGLSVDVAFELDTDPCWVKWEQPFTGIRRWPHYEDELSMGWYYESTEYKWLQPPDTTTMGMDVDATMEMTPVPMWWPQILADDFQCIVEGPITDIHIWGSWYKDELPGEPPDQHNVEFTLSIHDDIPAGTGGVPYSMPRDPPLWWRDFGPWEFFASVYSDTVREGYYSPCIPYYDPDGDTICWQYDFWIDPAEAFYQEGTPDEPVIYWLDVQARPLPDPVQPQPVRFGWKTSMEHHFDDAVWAIGDLWAHDPWQELWSPPQTEPRSLDLAFAITTLVEDITIDREIADDWPCDQNTPITAVAWWGSYIGYTYEACQSPPIAPPEKPYFFLLKIYKDVPAGADPNPDITWSHPGTLLWKYKAYNYDEVLVGYDKHPHDPGAIERREPVFRYSVKLPKEKWFLQEAEYGVYWLSVTAVYYTDSYVPYPWGWTNHEHVFNDNAVEGYWDYTVIPPMWVWLPLYDQTGITEDMSFVLFTEPECLARTDPGYATWLDFGMPDCWCYRKQCRGDTNGTMEMGRPVSGADLTLFKSAFNVPYATLKTTNPGGICADLNHTSEMGRPVSGADLTIFKQYFNDPDATVPECPMTHINFWKN
jgi:hypothetical protein